MRFFGVAMLLFAVALAAMSAADGNMTLMPINAAQAVTAGCLICVAAKRDRHSEGASGSEWPGEPSPPPTSQTPTPWCG
ncbi:hypothetical protein GCM10009595_16540 [Falsarthrobacter nasiphocae]|uniref:Uncharacterized protein n=1 Tax=Falsarthrobacter nasiphocae TaxID=189863 RepID=A0AAE3YEI2_9MICC|nr:hypothetical protein [Falsarthrobacter nasiphocae]